MTDFNQLLNKILSAPKDNTLYLLEKFPSEAGLFTSNGNVFYLVRNLEQCTPMSIKTDFLKLETNIYVSAFNPSVSSFDNGHYNSVELQLSDSSESKSNLSAFINLCLAHSTYLCGKDFTSFFDSLVSLFQLPREQQYKNLLGLIGELLWIEYVYQQFGKDLSDFWHTDGVSSKLDFVCPQFCFEIKTTISDSQTFTIKHNQLFSNVKNNYLIAVVLEENNKGRTLEEVILELFNDHNYCNSMRFTINVEKEKRRISPFEMRAKRFILQKITAYRASEINPFAIIPDNVGDLSYKLDLLSAPSVSLENIFS